MAESERKHIYDDGWCWCGKRHEPLDDEGLTPGGWAKSR